MKFPDKLFESIKSIGKMLLRSRSVDYGPKQSGRLIIMGNGPSLADTIRDKKPFLESSPLMAVNFAALSAEFFDLRPEFYVLADPHFFKDESEGNLGVLRQRFKTISWNMTLFVPVSMKKKALAIYANDTVVVRTFNPVGVEGFEWLERFSYSAKLGMPRPRNVLIPSIMIGVGLGFNEIVVVGADHSWMKTLWVTDDNEVVSVQPHFYTDSEHEQQRIRHEYRGYTLDQIVESFAVAFRSYHQIARFARRQNITIINATPESFIDAFEKRHIDSL